MPFINRLSTLFSADIHAVLDRIEDPMSLLKQAVRTMEEEIDKSELAVARMSEERERNRRRCDDLGRRIDTLDGELDICFASGESELAKNLVRRKLELKNRINELEQNRIEFDAALDKRHAALAEHRRHLESMREKLELLSDEYDHPQPLCDGSKVGGVTSEEVEIAFLKEQQRRAQQ